MPHLLRSPWIRLVLIAVFVAPAGIGLWLESVWLTQIGFWVLGLFILAAWGYEWQRWQRRKEVRENMRRILEERETKRFE